MLADAGIGCVVGLIFGGLSFGFQDGLPLWCHALAGLAGLALVSLAIRPLSRSM